MESKIVIIGAGEVGFNLAKSLSRENHEITVIDNNPQKCARVKNNLDVHVIEGDGASQRILQRVDMKNIDYLISLTRIDEINLVCSRIAKKMGAKHVICRLRNTEYIHKDAIITPEQFGIEYVTYPEKAAQIEIENLIRRSSTVEVQEFHNGDILMIGVNLESSSPLIGRTIENVMTSNPFTQHQTVFINRSDDFFIPRKDDIYKKNDHVYFVSRKEDVDEVQKMAGKPSFDVNNVMILGAGKIGRLLAKSLQFDYNVKIIEKNKDKAKAYSPNLSETLMLIGDGLDIEFLESENISNVDCFISATQNEQTNILAALLAKHYGAKQVVLHITTTSYLKSVRRIGADAIVSKNISAVNEVLNVIRSNEDNLEIHRFDDVGVEAIDVRVTDDSPYLKKNMSIDSLPEEFSIAAIIRSDKVIIPNMMTEIKSEDELLIFAKPDNAKDAESLFIVND